MIQQTGRKRNFDRLFGGFCGSAALIGAGVLLWIVFDLIKMGLPQLTPAFFTGDVLESGRGGGIAPVIKSTAWILMVCLAGAVPLGVGTAFWINEMAPPGSRTGNWLTGAIDLLGGIPSIVFGLFGMAFFCHFLGLGFSILAGGLTLACMILPVLVRTTLVAVRSVPVELRTSAAALGLQKGTILGRILFPRALPGIIIGVTIGIARALSETAALIFTSGYATRRPESLMDSGRSLSVHIYDLAMNIPNGGAKASASALVLLVALLCINLVVNFFTELWLKKSQ